MYFALFCALQQIWVKETSGRALFLHIKTAIVTGTLTVLGTVVQVGHTSWRLDAVTEVNEIDLEQSQFYILYIYNSVSLPSKRPED